MKFSKTTEYSLRILSYLSIDEKKLHTAKNIHENLGIPFRYLRKQLTVLSHSGLLLSIQGIKGGYKISKKPQEISLMDIVLATKDDIISEQCFFGFESCALIHKCTMHDKWRNIQSQITDVLQATTLQHIKNSEPNNFILNQIL